MDKKAALPFVAVVVLLRLMGQAGLVFADPYPTARPVPAVYLTDHPVVLPPDPILLARHVSPPVHAWLTDWIACELKGQNAGEKQIESLRLMISGTEFPLDQAGQLVQLVASLDGNVTATPLYPAIVDRAEKELKSQDGEGAKAVASALWPIHQILWDLQDRQTDVRLVGALLPFEHRGSGHSQWARYTYAELLYFLNRNPDAYTAYLDVQAERQMAYEPSEGVNRPLNWELGLTAAAAGKHMEAAAYFEAASNQFDFPSAKAASVGVFMELYAAGKHDEAIEKFKEHIQRYKLSRDEAVELAAQMTGMASK